MSFGSEPRVAVDDVNKALLCQVGKHLGHARLGDAHMLRDVDVSAAPALGADGEDLLEVVLGGITDAEDGQNPRQNPRRFPIGPIGRFPAEDGPYGRTGRPAP